MKSKILITGAGGFLGGRTVKHFVTLEKFEVIATSRRSHRKQELESDLSTFVPGDLSDPMFCDEITKNIDIVVHCAALSSPFGEFQQFYSSNFLATKYHLESSQKNGVKTFIYLSTPSIYFNFSNRFNVKESDPLPKKMVNSYAETKLLAEKLVLANNNDHFRTIALRPRAIIGAEDTVIFPRLLAAHEANRLKMIGRKDFVCDLTCVTNVIEAIKCAIFAKTDAFGQAFNITDGESVNFWHSVNFALTSLNYQPVTKRFPKRLAYLAASIFELKAKCMNNYSEPKITRYGIGILCNHFTLNIDKAKSILGYKPKFKTIDGIKEYIEWHKQMG